MRALLPAFCLPLALASLPAAALDCARLRHPRIDFKMTGEMKFLEMSIPVTIEASRGTITIVRMRAVDGSFDVLNEMRAFAPTRSVNGRTGETRTYDLRPVQGAMTNFEPGAEAIFEQTTRIAGKPVQDELVTQTVAEASARTISGCEIPVVRVKRVYEDAKAKTKRTSEFDFAPTLGYPLWSRAEIATPNGPRDQIVETKSLEIEEAK